VKEETSGDTGAREENGKGRNIYMKRKGERVGDLEKEEKRPCESRRFHNAPTVKDGDRGKVSTGELGRYVNLGNKKGL